MWKRQNIHINVKYIMIKRLSSTHRYYINVFDIIDDGRSKNSNLISNTGKSEVTSKKTVQVRRLNLLVKRTTELLRYYRLEIDEEKMKFIHFSLSTV